MTLRKHRTASDIAWYEMGIAAAAPLIACHGMALDHRDLAELLAPFADRWRIVLWDMPGHGTSGPLPTPCTLGAMADALEAVLDDAVLQDFVLLGFSFGGMVAQELLRRRKHRVRAFVAYACHAPFLAPAPLAPDAVKVLIEAMASMNWADLRTSFSSACSGQPDVQARLAGPIDRLGQQGLVDMTRALFAAFVPDPSFTPDPPILALRGDEDSNGAALVVSTRALLAAVRHGREAVIAEAGHCAHLDRPEATRAALSQFLDGL